MKYPGLLQPLEVANQSWQVISMDFVEGLPKSDHYSCVLVVVDTFSKYAHFVPLAHPYTAQSVATAFMNNIYKLHGLPEAIISDRERVFTSKLWQELFRLSGTQLKMSSAYHPQTDGKTERVNQCLETYLRCFLQTCPRQWVKWLHLAEYWYNTCFHSSTGRTPFEVVYGQSPKHFGVDSIECCAVPDLQEWMAERDLMTQLVKQHLQRAQQKMKVQADKKRSDQSFLVGDKVFLKLQPYVQQSVAPRANSKLAFKYFGPFEILQKIGQVAYKLQLPEGSLIHPVFHVSQLKKYIGSDTQVSSVIPEPIDYNPVAESAIGDRICNVKGKVQLQVLVQWKGWPRNMATWEPKVVSISLMDCLEDETNL